MRPPAAAVATKNTGWRAIIAACLSFSASKKSAIGGTYPPGPAPSPPRREVSRPAIRRDTQPAGREGSGMRGSLIVRRALEQARRAQREAASLAPPIRGTSGIGRRALLKLMAAAAGTAALPLASCSLASAGEVAIVGGG